MSTRSKPGRPRRGRGSTPGLRGMLLDNLPYKLLSVIIALGLWFVVQDERVSTQLEVPVRVDPPSGLVIVSDPPQWVTVRVTGTRIALDRIKRSGVPQHEIELRANGPGPVDAQIRPGDVSMSGVTVTDVDPSRFEIYLERQAVREFPVQPRLLGRPALGYVLGEPEVEPARVRVAGAASLIRSMDRVYTEPISVEGRRESFQESYSISLPQRQVWLAERGQEVQVSVSISRAATPTPDVSPTQGSSLP